MTSESQSKPALPRIHGNTNPLALKQKQTQTQSDYVVSFCLFFYFLHCCTIAGGDEGPGELVRGSVEDRPTNEQDDA